MNIEDIENAIHKLQGELKSSLNQLRNLYRENQCYKEFIRGRNLDDDYMKWREQFYHQRLERRNNKEINKETNNKKWGTRRT